MSTELNEIQKAASEQFGKQSHRYGAGHILEKVEDVESALGKIVLPAKARVLDVATGAGHTGLFLASLGHLVTLSDITEPMLQRAKEAADARGLAVQLRQHSAEAMPYADGSFDLVTCRVAPHHFSSPENFVKEVARILVPGGYFLLIDGTVQDDAPEVEAWLHHVEKFRDPSHHRFLSPRTWKILCDLSGLSIEMSELHTRKQPDLTWYFEAANTSPANREAVLKLVENAPASVRQLLGLAEEQGKIVWWWQMLTLIAHKPGK